MTTPDDQPAAADGGSPSPPARAKLALNARARRIAALLAIVILVGGAAVLAFVVLAGGDSEPTPQSALAGDAPDQRDAESAGAVASPRSQPGASATPSVGGDVAAAPTTGSAGGPAATVAPRAPAPTPVPRPAVPVLPGSRDKRAWPFSSYSIWNMPLGSDAAYVPAGIGEAGSFTVDEEYMVFPEPTDPVVPVFTNAIWGEGRCAQDTYEYSVHLPPDFLVPDAVPGYTPNAPGAVLDVDGRTVRQMQPISRCEEGGALTAGWLAEDEDIYADGIQGAHGGSGLSSIGGSLRRGELTGPDPIRHALKVNLWGERWLSADAGGHRWPAVHADADYDDPESDNAYGGEVPSLRMGALLAIAPDVDLDSLGLRTPAARKIAWTLQNYGAYVVDNTTQDTHGIAVEAGAVTEFQDTFGYDMDSGDGPWYDDMMRIFEALSVVDNNGPSSIGGGGLPRQALAPPIGN